MSETRSLRLRAVVFDWAGTIVDHGSLAPVEAFREVFHRRGVPISSPEARAPMGMEKRDHIAAILAMPRVADAWRQIHGRDASDADLMAMYEEFLPVQRELLARHADVIDGVLETIADCRRRGLRIGSSSGYAAPLMDQLVRLTRAAGLQLDAVVAATEVPAGRPAPWMIYKNMERLDVYPPASVVTVDDTVVGVEAGVNAGTWSVGVVETGNLFGLTRAELERLAPDDREKRRALGEKAMLDAGAHYAISSVVELPAVLEAIAERVASGEHP
jgi:phosphonoacetaldehyde hydrolase